MIRTIERMLSGTALLTASAALLGLAIVLLAQSQSDRLEHYLLNRYVYVQGDTVERQGEGPLRLPGVLQDGRLDPAWTFHSLDQWEGIPGGVTLAQFQEQDTTPIGAYPHDYRRPSGGSLVWLGQSRWKITVQGEILRHADDGSLEGSLTDDGWRPGRREPCSLRNAEWWGLDGFSGQGHDGMSFAYISGGALHLADLQKRVIHRLLPGVADGWYAVFYSRNDPLVFVLTGKRIHRVPMREPEKATSFEPPPRFRGAANVQGASGTDGRLILRIEEPGSRTGHSVRYHVAILGPSGDLVEEYGYDLAVTPPDRLIPGYAVMPATAIAPIKEGAAGRFASRLMPLAGWGFLALLEGVFDPQVYRQLRSDFLFFFDFPAAIVLGMLLGAVTAIRTRRVGAGWGVVAGWAAFVVVLGIPAVATWYFLGARERLERCPCGRTRSSRRAACPDCGAAAEAPARLGIEILKPA